MADQCFKFGSWQYNGLRRRSKPDPWMWFVVSLISLPCILSSCQGVDNVFIAVYPEGTVKVRYGEPLEIFCVAEKNTSDDLHFTLNGIEIPSEIVNSTTRRLFISKPERQLSTFYCTNKRTKKICISRVLVDSPPIDVQDFACISKNLDVLNCTWTFPEMYSFLNSSLTFIVNGNAVEPCIAVRNGNTRHCSWNTYSMPRYRQMETKYNFQLTSCNVFGCKQQLFTIDHFAVVKPDAPTDLKVLKNHSHSVMLQWNISHNMADLLPCGVDHRIEYQIAKIDNTSYFRSVDVSGLPPKNRTYKFVLDDLPYAHMLYEVRIYIKSKAAVQEQFWSDFTYIVFYTASEKPQRPPDTIIGAFNQGPYQTKRLIYIYWKQLEEYEEAGTNFTYKVVVTQRKKNYQTLLADKNKSLSYVILENASLDALDVSIWSMNEIGSSVNSSHLYIPPQDATESLRVPSFTKLAYENGTYKLSWVGIKHIDNYTLFWCQHNATQICAGRMNFIVLNSRKTIHVIDLPRENRYQFAISANNGTKTSGMVWATCDISKDGIPMYGFPVKMDRSAPGKSFVKITWTMACTLQEGIITGYLISYCPVLDTTSLCATKNKTEYYIDDPKMTEINITQLEPYTTYLFTLALNTTYGLKTIENASIGVTTLEDTPTSPINISITDIENDSLIISWDPPLHKNGVIGKYVVNNYGQKFLEVKVPDKDKDVLRRDVRLTGLKGFTNYSLTVQACNAAISSCSIISPNDAMFVRTKIGPPSKLNQPTMTSNPDILEWTPPKDRGGTVDLYQIKHVKDDNLTPDIQNTTILSFPLTNCQGGVAVESYQVRAVNYDEEDNHGTLTDKMQVELPVKKDKRRLEYPGEWSDSIIVKCKSREGLTMTLILISVFALVGVMYGSIKCYKKYRKMEDIKPVLPNGLGVPEKDISKYAFGGWNPSNKDEKPSSDEMLLLPNSRTTVSSPEVKKDNDNCASSDHTDSTGLSDTSRGPMDRQVSTSDDGSDSSLHLEVEAAGIIGPDKTQDEEDSSNSDTEVSRENSPYFSDKEFKKNPVSGYVQQPVVKPTTGYVQSAPAPVNSPAKAPAFAASSSYVMAALSPPIFTTGVAPLSVPSHPPPSSGYVRAEDAEAQSAMNLPKMRLSPSKLFGPESLPTMPSLPPPAKHGADSSYIQLQSLDSLPSHKQPVRNTVPLKPPASSGYVSQGDAVINKHLNNMLSGGQLADESVILDPTMSPDAYCRFSWSTDPANDNLNSLLSDSPRINSFNN